MTALPGLASAAPSGLAAAGETSGQELSVNIAVPPLPEASQATMSLCCCCSALLLSVELVDSLVALVALLSDLVGALRLFLCLASSLAALAELRNGDTPLHFD